MFCQFSTAQQGDPVTHTCIHAFFSHDHAPSLVTRQTPYDFTSIWNLILGTNEPFHRKENHGHGEQTCGCQEGGEGKGRDWEFGVNRCKLFPLEWMSSEILLYSTGNYAWSLMMEHDNVRKKNVHM